MFLSNGDASYCKAVYCLQQRARMSGRLFGWNARLRQPPARQCALVGDVAVVPKRLIDSRLRDDGNGGGVLTRMDIPTGVAQSGTCETKGYGERVGAVLVSV